MQISLANDGSCNNSKNAHYLSSYMFACNFSYITHEKNALAILHPLFLLFFTLADSPLKAFKGTIYVCIQSLFLQFSFGKIGEKAKEIQFNEWKFMHMEISNNSSNQSDFNKRSFFSYYSYSAVFLCTAKLYLHIKEERSFGVSLRF